MYVDLYQRGADKRINTTPEMEEYSKRRTMSIMLCMNWVCTGTFDDHEWVSESTITQHVEEVMGRGLDYKNLYSVCGTMVHVMVLGANKAESNIGKTRYKNRKVPHNRGWGFAQDKQKLGREQGVGRMEDGR